MVSKCSECGSFWDTTTCIKTRKTVCRSCCDTDCGNHFSCWGRYY